MKKHTTSINERAKSVLGISRDEYALCQYVQYRSADPRSKAKGYCTDTKDEIAEFIGVTRPGLYKMVDKMVREGLIERDVFGYLCITGKWIDTESECKQSLQKGVNKVYSERKQNLQHSVNKVDTHNKVKKDIKKEEERDGEGEAPTHPQPDEPVSNPYQFEAQKEKEKDVAPPPQIPLDARPGAKTPAALVADMRKFYIDYPKEWSDGILQLAKGVQFSEDRRQQIVTAWATHQIAQNQGNNTFSQLNASLQKWFLNQKDFDRQYGKTVDVAKPSASIDNSKPLPAYVD